MFLLLLLEVSLKRFPQRDITKYLQYINSIVRMDDDIYGTNMAHRRLMILLKLSSGFNSLLCVYTQLKCHTIRLCLIIIHRILYISLCVNNM